LYRQRLQGQLTDIKRQFALTTLSRYVYSYLTTDSTHWLIHTLEWQSKFVNSGYIITVRVGCIDNSVNNINDDDDK